MDSTQMKGKKKKQVQKKAVQRNSANSFGADFSSKGATTAMPRPVQQKMENSFGADFSNVLIHRDSGSATNMGALAYAQGNEVHFAPGQYNPETQKGQELLGHELTHVIQQRQGRVQATTQGKGMAINDDPTVEREADAMGTKAAESDRPILQKSVHENGSTSPNESQERSEFYYDAIDGMTLNNGDKLSRNELSLSFDKLSGNATYLGFKNSKHYINLNIKNYEISKGNLRALMDHEVFGHGIEGYSDKTNDHYKAYYASIDSQYWASTTEQFRIHVAEGLWLTWTRAGKYGGMPSKYMDVIYVYHPSYK